MAIGALVGIIHLLLLFLCTYFSANNGLTTDLIHRDSPLSPFYNSSITHYDRFQNAIQRSMNRIKDFNNGKMEAPLTPGTGEYYMKVSLGTPPVELLGIADTGSDLIWTQCFPCNHCFKQKLPLFNPNRSSSYKTILCHSDSCNSLPHQSCGKDSTCEYNYGYGDQSFSKGDLATETFTMEGSCNVDDDNKSSDSSSLNNIVFGCGHSSGGNFEDSVNGLVGLGGGNLSLVSQLGVDGKKFSYCLTSDLNSTSKISFGRDAVVSGSQVVKTPIITKRGQETFYYLTLKSFTVGRKVIAFSQKDEKRAIIHDDYGGGGGDAAAAAEEGNIIIDSGTTLTVVPQYILHDLILALEEATRLPKVDDPSGQFQLCYSIGGDNHNKIPNVIANFKGADVVLKPKNNFALVTDTIVCLMMIPSDEVAIFGNFAQMDFLIGYDLDARLVSFMPTDCTN